MPMTNCIVYISPDDPAERWRDALIPVLPEVDFARDFHVWPQAMQTLEDPSLVDIAIVWRPPREALKIFPNLKAVINLGAGVDAIMADPTYPAGVPLVRMIDPALTRHMSEFVVHRVLHFHRKFHIYEQMHRDRDWRELEQDDTLQKRVGILGLGNLGMDAARQLAPFDFQLAGWSRSEKHMDGVQSFYGHDGLEPFLARTDILVCLLPLTPETEGILNAQTLKQLPKGAYVINAGRGAQINEPDLLAALDEGHLGGAALDVFAREPLPGDSPMWTHAKVLVTPHIASLSSAKSAAREIAENIRRIRRGDTPKDLVDMKAGY
jgi:glyoxylate/hydroxypyruvate reductase